MAELKVVYVDIDNVIPYENNPRINDEAVDKVASSIREFGWQQPIVVDKNNVIIVGHTRLKAAQMLGEKKVPVVFADLSDERAKAYRLVDNRTGQIAEWDFELLEQELDELSEMELDFDMGDFGFDIEEGNEVEQEITEDEVPELPKEPVCKAGDLWKLGEHRLICGDSTDPAVIDRLMDGVKADMLLTDPPYNVDYTGKTKDALKIQNDKMDNDSFRQFLRDAFASADSVMRAGAVFYIWHADSEGYNFRGACADNNWKVRECLIWNKNSMVLGRQDYQWKHEPCLYGWKDGASHLWASDRKQTTVLNFDRPIRADLHPTMKPIGLFAYQIGNNTHEGDVVLDLFGGSGSTLIACEQLNRKCYMCELDPQYCDVIIQRWENFTGEKADKIGLETDGEP